MSGKKHIHHVIFGKPISTKYAHMERLAPLAALPVFASDALSSTAYAGEEILHKLAHGGSDKLWYLLPITGALLILLWIVIFSYKQTIHAYPTGGGSYSVASANLGTTPALLAAGALLIGYILTVSVSVAAGASAIVAMAPQVKTFVVPLCALAVALITYVNMRGTKESGGIFAIPTYSFVLLLVAIFIWGIIQGSSAHFAVTPPPFHAPEKGFENLTGGGLVLFLFTAFAAGCTALTGTEAIANGVLAFKKPEPANATKTLVMMGCILTVLVAGTSYFAYTKGITPMSFEEHDYKTVLAMVAERVFGAGSPMFYMTQVATALILMLAANTAFADFPRLSMVVARDGFLPRQLTTLGDRLVYGNGIVALAVLSVVLIVVTGGNTSALLPMYAVSVFMTFTLSQAGMVRFWWKKSGISISLLVNALGALVCGVVAILLMYTRFWEGAWITIVALIGCMIFFAQIRKHYDWLGKKLSVTPEDKVVPSTLTVLLLVPRLHKGILNAISYAEALSKDVRAVHVTLGSDSAQQVKEDWNKFGQDIPMVILESPYRSFVGPVVDYVDETLMEHEGENHMVTVIVPQAIPGNLWQSFLHSNVAWQLKRALKGKKNVVIANVRYFLE
jgi:amino acid transporter